ncbi:4,4'-diaponeurosporenoate glycosyltransferase [Sinobaca qinghaiensis]|uniref:4,4'-diaponeurosporenoate glycosyltransferase n=1 Tax=Sinobaca qinghaiensis TaxID=342944 RepID=A0A419V514_9BACL|nr:glycosyltransferase [Sinobaca qinghaiensis]RKD73618.1 4,4'-diaponeurosporenoate glycosyltransferase [Sinobaca qinghaiensis]
MMWFLVTAVLATLLLFWQRVSFPIVPVKETGTYSIIIPARDEEKNLKRLLPSLLAVPNDKREVIVVDDDSSDGTKETAASFGVKVISTPPLPKGWMGKSWACFQGARQAGGDTLCFLDADTWFSEDGPDRMIRYLEQPEAASFVTVHPFHFMYSFWEKLSAVFHLVVFASSGITHIFAKQSWAQGGFGPCLLIKREMYWEMGGHECIKSEIVEHLAFARKAQHQGIETRAFSGRGVLNMRMYEARLIDVVQGWSKSFASGAKTASLWLTAANVIWITAVVSFFVNSPEAGWWSLAGYLAIALWLYKTLRDIGNFRWFDALLFPVYFVFFVCIFMYSLLKTFFFKKATWKGRNIAGK